MCCARPGAEVLGIVSIFTYGMQKGLERLAAANVKNVSLTDFDTVAEVAAARAVIFARGGYGTAARTSATNPADESWIGGEQMKEDLIDILRSLAGGDRRTSSPRRRTSSPTPRPTAKSATCKKLATLFFEPSTRTRLSFEAAMYELGGSVLGFSDGQRQLRLQGRERRPTPSATVSCYADIIAMRHPKEGAPLCCRA